MILKENEVLINKPFIPLVGAMNSVIVQDEHGFKYKKGYESKKDGTIVWMCRKWRLGCICAIKTRGDMIILQRHQHNHE